jgi:hypothetical protein
MATPKAEPAEVKPVTVSGKVPRDHAERAHAKASRNGTNVSALIATSIADYVATA